MADKRIKGITIQIDGDTKKLNDALKDVNKQISQSNAELKDLRSALKLDPKNVELLAQKQEVLQKEVKATTDRLNTLKETQRQMGDYNQLTDEQKENYRALSVEIAKTESQLKSFKDELKETSKFDLNKLNDSLSGIRETTGKIVANLAKVATAVGGSLIALGTASIKSYADYEQLVGGVETLFKDSADEIKKYAQNAYKTAGLSANNYMETVTSFSASLIQSLGGDTQKATKYADLAITDMADNANKMGTSIDSIQNAYQGFAKQNYTMLDNLKLGYGGTKTEMQRLIADANKVKEANGEMANLSIERFSDMVEAIHIIQKEMGITGTTAKEADNTITGSVNSMKASWGNLLVAISDDNADMEKAVNDFVDSAITAGKNIVPRIKTAIEGIKKLFNSLVRDIFPKLKREIPELKPLINIFEWFIEHKNLVINAIKAIIAVFVATKIVDFTTKIKNLVSTFTSFASGSVLGAVTTGIAGVIAVATLLEDVFSNLDEEAKKLREEQERHIEVLNEQKNSWQELKDAQNEQVTQGLGELNYYENLYRELQDITDENGKVKDGYEERAKFIVGQLNDALDTEIEMNGNVVESYGNVEEAIQKVMDKKRADIIMDAQNKQYQEALTKKQEAYDNMISLEQDYLYWQDKYNEQLEKGRTEDNDSATKWIKYKYDSTKEAYDEQYNLYDEYLYTIAQYERNLQYINEEAYDKIDYRTYQSTLNYKNASDAKRAQLEDDIEHTKAELDRYKKLYEESGNDIYKQKVEDDERLLKEQQEELKKYISAYETKTGDIFQVGANFSQGLLNGINSKKGSIFTAVSNLGLNILNKFKSSLKEQSPSKATREMGQYLLEGISLGLKDEQNSLLNQVDSLGNSIIDGFYSNTVSAMNGLGGLMSTSLNPTINPSVAYDLNYKLMANAMKEALQEVNVELDDREVGRFIDKTVSEEVFN